MTELFALSIIKENGKNFKFQAKSENMNVYEIIALLRRYCDELEKKFLDNTFKNVTFEIGNK